MEEILRGHLFQWSAAIELETLQLISCLIGVAPGISDLDILNWFIAMDITTRDYYPQQDTLMSTQGQTTNTDINSDLESDYITDSTSRYDDDTLDIEEELSIPPVRADLARLLPSANREAFKSFLSIRGKGTPALRVLIEDFFVKAIGRLKY
ncbi:hypothetical protein BDV12DRAFT_199255 [Aspergillus spectabilis]